METAIIDLLALHAANKCAASDPTRYYLEGVCVEFSEREIVYVATDGHILFAYRQISAEHTLRGSYIIPSAVIKAAKIRRGDNVTDLVKHENGKLELRQAGWPSALFDPVDGTFPDWRRVIPETAKPDLAHYNPELLCRLWAAGKVIGAEASLHQNGNSPALVTYTEGNALGVIMPMSSLSADTSAPSWALPPSVAKAA
jgi:DNA polymerase-3 subunit beta